MPATIAAVVANLATKCMPAASHPSSGPPALALRGIASVRRAHDGRRDLIRPDDTYRRDALRGRPLPGGTMPPWNSLLGDLLDQSQRRCARKPIRGG